MQEEIFQLGLKALIKNDSNQILLLKANATNFSGSEHWDLPGGRIQKGENIDDALKREIFEESGINNVKSFKQKYFTIANFRIEENKYALLLGIYECEVDNYSNIKLSDEHTEYKWVTIKEAKKLLSHKYTEDFLEKLSNSLY